MTKRYILMKDLPNIKADSILTVNADNKYETIDKYKETAFLNHKLVENNSEWFKKIIEEPEYAYINGKKYIVENRTGSKEKPIRMILREVKEEEPIMVREIDNGKLEFISENRTITCKIKELWNYLYCNNPISQNSWSDNDMIEFANMVVKKSEDGLNAGKRWLYYADNTDVEVYKKKKSCK